MKLKMFEKLCREGASDRTGIFVQVEESMTYGFYVGFSGFLKTALFAFATVCGAFRHRVNIHTRLGKNKMAKKKKGWVRPERKSFHACTTITLCFSCCLLGFHRCTTW